MHISDDEFERAIEQVLDDLPERFARVLENVGIVVADEPNERELATMSNPCGELLGLYGGVMPDVITLFKGPHERVCSTQAELRQRIRKTVLHEIGHFFGFDDEYLHSHGY